MTTKEPQDLSLERIDEFLDDLAGYVASSPYTMRVDILSAALRMARRAAVAEKNENAALKERNEWAFRHGEIRGELHNVEQERDRLSARVKELEAEVKARDFINTVSYQNRFQAACAAMKGLISKAPSITGYVGDPEIESIRGRVCAASVRYADALLARLREHPAASEQEKP